MLKSSKHLINFFSPSSSLLQTSRLSRGPSLFLPKSLYNFSVDPNNPFQRHFNQPPRQPKQPQAPPPPQQPKKSSSRILFLALAAIAGFGLSYYQNMMPKEEVEVDGRKGQKKVTTIVEQPKIGGSWRLTDTKNNLVTEKDLEGYYYMIYFGFCFCPDICPETLTKLSKAVEILKKDPSFPIDKLKTVFVTIDPDRDTPERLEKFLSTFNNMDIIGVRGLSNEDPHLKDIMKKFRIIASKVSIQGVHGEAKDNQNAYSFDHTTIVYLMDKKNNCISHLSPTLTSQDVADQLKKAIKQNK